MSSIIGILLTSIVVMFVLMLFSIWLMNFSLRMYIGRKHEVLEEIAETRQIPRKWSQKTEQRMYRRGLRSKRGAMPVAGDVTKEAAIRQAAESMYRRKLRRLEKYVKTSKLVQDEEARQVLLDSINSISCEWRNSKHAFRIRAAQTQGKR